jgi:hypothetical protein
MANEVESPLVVLVLPDSGLSFERVRKSQGTPLMGVGEDGSDLTKLSSREELNQSEGLGLDMIGRGEKRGVDTEGEGSRDMRVGTPQKDMSEYCR